MRTVGYLALTLVLAGCGPASLPTTTSSSPAQTVPTTTVPPSTVPSTTTTTQPAPSSSTTTTTLAAIPMIETLEPLPQAEAYDPSGKARRVWLPGSEGGLVIDLATGSVGRLPAPPFGEAQRGLVTEEGTLLLEAEGRLWLGAPTGEWRDLSPAPGSHRLAGYTPGAHEYPHLHLYVADEAGRLHNLELRFRTQDRLYPKWVVKAGAITRVSVGSEAHLLLTETAGGEFPNYAILGEGSGAARPTPHFPQPEEGRLWAAEFLDGTSLAYHVCTEGTWAACGTDPAFVTDLDTGDTIPIEERIPSYSSEWGRPGDPPPLSLRYADNLLLTGHHLFLVDLATGERTLLLRASQR